MSEDIENKKNNTKTSVNKIVEKEQDSEKKGTRKTTTNSKINEKSNQVTTKINTKTGTKVVEKMPTKTTSKMATKTPTKTTSKTSTNKNISKNTTKTSSTVKKDVIQYNPKKNNSTNNDNKKVVTDEKANETINKKNEKKIEYPDVANKKKKRGKSSIPYKRTVKGEFDDETKYDTVSLVDIRKAIENKVNPNQKKDLFKQILVNVGMAIGMCLFFIIILFIYNKIQTNILENSLKIITICFMIVGVFILEKSYKKDSVSMALKSIEIAFFAGLCLFLMYSTKIHYDNINNIIIKTMIGILTYYLVKIIIFSIRSVKKFKKENSDIKDIIKK